MFVHTDSRGTGHSPTGQWDLFGQEMQNDLYDMIEWIAVQDWCDGKVGMLGESLLAWSQWFTAVQQPPHLTCILPWDAGADMYRDVAWHGGMMAVGFPTAWHMWEIRGPLPPGHPRRASAPRPPTRRWASWDLVWNVINHPTCDDFWKLRSPDFSKIQCPVFVVGALHKVGLHLRGVVRGYEEVETPKKMMLIHGVMDGDEMAIYNSPEMQLLMLRWYDHWLKGNDTGFMDEPPVSHLRARRRRVPRVRRLAAAADRVPQALLQRGPERRRRLAERRQSLLGAAGARPTAPSPTPIPTRTGPTSPAAARRRIEERHRLRPAAHPHLHERAPRGGPAGVGQHRPGALRLLRSEEHRLLRAAWWTRLPDDEQIPGMPPKGFILTRGWLKASHACTKSEELSKPYRPYYLHDEPQPIEPGKIYKYEIEVWPTSNLFKKGHRIRIDVACGDSPALDFGGHYYGIKVGTDTYYHEADAPVARRPAGDPPA